MIRSPCFNSTPASPSSLSPFTNVFPSAASTSKSVAVFPAVTILACLKAMPHPPTKTSGGSAPPRRPMVSSPSLHGVTSFPLSNSSSCTLAICNPVTASGLETEPPAEAASFNLSSKLRCISWSARSISAFSSSACLILASCSCFIFSSSSADIPASPPPSRETPPCSRSFFMRSFSSFSIRISFACGSSLTSAIFLIFLARSA
mmetsp:Transcript_36506/g.87784  ORF Transcript_36506/g.87784 Transcript_36506/m.87784 type:complete len:204 (+) Transcript_36506:1754-2365(+)